jgi:hypothetical protein
LSANASHPFGRVVLISLLALLIYGAAQMRWGEKIPVNHGLGYDGLRYAYVARDFPRAVFQERLNAYRLGRVVPSGLVYVSLKALGLPRDPDHIRTAFEVLNLALLLVTALAWAGIVRELGISGTGRWLSYCLLFINFANLRMPFYCGVLTDTTALALGTLAVYFHFRANSLGLLAVLCIGAFTWPSFFVLAGPLYVFSRRSLGDDANKRGWLPLAAAGVAVMLSLIAFQMTRDPKIPVTGARMATILVELVFIFVVVRDLLGHPRLLDGSTFRVQTHWSRVVIIILLLGGIRFVVSRLSKGSGYSLSAHIASIFLDSPTFPGVFLVAHAVYFGPVVLLAVAYWPALCRQAHRLGVGMVLFVAGHLLLAAYPISRQVIDGLPSLVLLVVLCVESARWPAWAGGVVALLAIVGSKVWFHMNQGEFGDPLDSPAQRYFMNHGPYMSFSSFWMQSLAVGVAGLIVYVFSRCWAARNGEGGPTNRIDDGTAAARPPSDLLERADAEGWADPNADRPGR